ncbi:MAG: type II secretion system F family protein [Bacillota bacterium]
MVLYHYRARTPQGRTLEGTVDAPSQREAANILRGRGLLVTVLSESRTAAGGPGLRAARETRRPAAPGRGLGRTDARPSRKVRVSQKELALFCRQFATMIDAGVTILASLGILSRQLASKRMRSAVAQVRWLIEQGQSLSDAFRSRPDVFPALLVNMVAAGEASGTLEESFERLADHFEKEYAVTQKVRTAMAYPTIVTIVALGVIVFMVVFVLPSFIGIFASIGAELPWPTRLVMGVSDFIRANWYLLAALLALGVIVVKFLSSTPNGAYTLDSLALRLPLFGELILKRAVSRFSRTLATLLRSGVPLLVSLSVTERTVGNLPVAAAISMASEEIRAGRGIVEPLRASRLFPQMIIEMMVVGEETGTVDQMLSKVADFYDKEIDVTVERLSSLIEPVIIVVLGAVVGFIMLSLIMPMFDIYSQLNL